VDTRILAALPALVLTALAFRSLAGFDPGRRLSHEVGPLFVPSDTAPGFVFGLIALVLYLRHRRIAQALRLGRPTAAGLLFMLPATALFAWTQHTRAGDLELIALIVWMLGVVLLLGGTMLLRLLALPLLLLLFAYPMPAVLANRVIWGFQQGTAGMTTFVLDAIGVKAATEGDMIYTRGFVFEVIETCAGLRIVETLLLSAFAYGQILCDDRRHQVLLVLIAPFLGFALNTARVLMIVFTPGSYLARDHTVQGLTVIVLGVFALAGIDALLHRVPALSSPPRPRRPLAAAGPPSRWPWVAATLAAGLCALTATVPAWAWTAGRPPWKVQLPLQIDGWEGKRVKNDDTFLGSVAFVHSLHREYTRGDESVTIFVAMDDRLQRDRSALSPKHLVPGPGWKIREADPRPVPWADGLVEAVATSRGRSLLVWQWYAGADSFGRELWRQVAAIDNSAWRPGGDLLVYRVSTPIGPGADAWIAAQHRLALFAEQLREATPP